MRRWAAGWVATIAGAAALAGCGSSTGPTKAHYVARANAVCLALERKIKAVGQNRFNVETKVRELVPVHEQADAQLQAIPKPSSDTVPSEWLQSRKLATADNKKAIEAKPSSPARAAAARAEYQPREKARALARAYGLTVCARS